MNKRANNLKQFNAFQLLILSRKFQGKTDKEIAEEFGCNPDTVWRNKKLILESEMFKDAKKDLASLLPLGIESARALLLNADSLFTSKFFEGLGLFKSFQVLEGSTPEQSQEKLSQALSKAFGLVPEPKNRIAGLIEEPKKEPDEPV